MRISLFDHTKARVHSMRILFPPVSFSSRAECGVNQSYLEPIRHVAEVHGRENQASQF